MSNLKVNTINDASGGNAAKLYGSSMRYGGTAFVNRIINGDMRIDQRNGGASVTADNGVFGVDRFNTLASVAGKLSAQRNAGGVTPPTGFTNYLGYTTTSAYSVGASEVFALAQNIEGFNIADLMWGTANAQAVTVSFWVRSSLTGTFSGFLTNSNNTRSYVFSYTISAANTWEQKTVTVPGDTTGTWLTDNGRGIRVFWTLGAGASLTGSAGSWVASDKYGVTGTTSVVGTNGATFYITGVQLEAGTVASPFERRDYGCELMMCQRYYWTGNSTVYGYYGFGSNWPNSGWISFPVTMRTAPTVTFGSAISVSLTNSESANYIATNGFAYTVNVTSTGTIVRVNPTFATAEL